MLFKEYHIPMIRSGSKTVTRREWDDNYHGPNVGTVVAAKTDLLKPDEECDCFIKITGKREEQLGEITEEGARREGDYEDIYEFRDGYEDVYGDGSWDPEQVVTVVEFGYVGRQRPEDRDGEQRDVCPECGCVGEFLGETVSGGPSVGVGAPNYVEHYRCLAPNCEHEWRGR